MSTKKTSKNPPAEKPASKNKKKNMTDENQNQPAESQFPIEVLPLKEIKATAKTQVREKLNEEAKTAYRESAKEWKDKGAQETNFPAFVIFREVVKKEGKEDVVNNWLADGFHRLDATKEAGFTDHRCEIREGTQFDAFLFGVKANANHGVRLTNKDKKHALLTALDNKELVKLSNNALAGVLNVSEGFVRGNRPKHLCPEFVEVKKKGGGTKKASTKKKPKAKKGDEPATTEPASTDAPTSTQDPAANPDPTAPAGNNPPPNADEQQAAKGALDDKAEQNLNKIVVALNKAKPGSGDAVRKAINDGSLPMSNTTIREWSSHGEDRIQLLAPLLTVNRWTSVKKCNNFLDQSIEGKTTIETLINFAAIKDGITSEIVDGYRVIVLDMEKFDCTGNYVHRTLNIAPKGFVPPPDEPEVNDDPTVVHDAEQAPEEEMAGV